MNPLNPLYDAVAWLIMRIHSVVGAVIAPGSGLAWVLTIVLLVVLMRLVLVPLFVRQMHATRKMSALAPQLAELKKKYKNDRQTLNEETMKLYRENGVNPLGGCLPLVAQLPLFFALFGVLRAISGWHPGQAVPYGLTESVIRSAQGANVLGAKIADKVLFTPSNLHVPLEAKFVIICAVLISVVTTFMTVRQSTKRGLTPQMTPDNPMAQSQKYMNYVVPLFALSGLYWQFGLVLYWVTTNVWTLGQQWVLFRRYPNAPVLAGAGGAAAGATAAGLVPNGSKPASKPAAPASAADRAKRPASAGKTTTARTATGQPAAAKTSSGTPAKPGTAKPGTARTGTAKPGTAKPAAAKTGTASTGTSGTGTGRIGTARTGTAKPGAAKPGTTEAKATPGHAKPATTPAKPGTSSVKPAGTQATKPAPGQSEPAEPEPTATAKPSGSNGRANAETTANGTGGLGLLRRLGRRSESEQIPESPEVKLVRQQRVRQSRSKRSGKR